AQAVCHGALLPQPRFGVRLGIAALDALLDTCAGGNRKEASKAAIPRPTPNPPTFYRRRHILYSTAPGTRHLICFNTPTLTARAAPLPPLPFAPPCRRTWEMLC